MLTVSGPHTANTRLHEHHQALDNGCSQVDGSSAENIHPFSLLISLTAIIIACFIYKYHEFYHNEIIDVRYIFAVFVMLQYFT